jgi:transcription initiation factor TFIID subunit 2
MMDNSASLVEEPGAMDDRAHRRPRSRDQPPQPYMILEQSVELEVHFREKRLSGRVEVWLHTLDKVEEIALDARQSIIDLENITVEGFRGNASQGAKKVPASYTDKYSLLRLPTNWSITAEHHDIRRIRMQPIVQSRARDLPANSRDGYGCTPVDGSLKIKLRPKDDVVTERPKLIIRKSTVGSDTPLVGAIQPQQTEVTQYKITIPFSTSEIRDGVQFVGVDPGDMRFPHVFSRHSIEPGTASCIFPCVDDYGARCDWRISLKMPRTLGDTLEQALVTQQAGDSGGRKQERHYTLEEKGKLLEMTAVCSGRLSDEVVDPLDHSKKIMTFESQRSTSAQKIGFAIGPFEHVDLWSAFRTEEDDEKLGANALKIHGYCLPGRADMVRNTCAAIAAAADFFTLTFATHPFDSFKLCFVDDMLRDIEPLHSFSLISNRLLYPDDIIDPEIDVTRTIVLSLASQWASINLVANTREDLWLVVGIAHYMTELFMKRLCGNNEYRFRMKTLSDQLVELDVNRPSLYELGKHLHLGDFEMDFMALKAPLVLFILDKRLAKATGSAGLTKILSKLLVKANIQDTDSIVSTESFRKACERGGKYKLDTFWTQWVFGSGCPRFKMTQRFNKKRLCIEMTLRQIQDEAAGKKRPLEKSGFLRLVRESLHGVTGGATQHLFTGPMTIRIHEADGTPYEHIVEISPTLARTFGSWSASRTT